MKSIRNFGLPRPREARERMMMLRRISAFMAWKKALGFILSSELQVPDCVYALGVNGEIRCMRGWHG